MHLVRAEIVTQIIGFVVAVWILKRFAWKPMLGLLEERRARIQHELEESTADREKAARALAEIESRLRDIDGEARARIQEAVREGQMVAAEVKDQGRKEAGMFLQRAREEVDRERVKARMELRREVVDLSLAAAGKLLGETVDEERNRKMVDDFIEDLGGIK